MADKRRYLMVLEVESDINFDEAGPPFSVGGRWCPFDIYPNHNCDGLPPTDDDGNKDYKLDLVEICSIKDMGEASD